MANQLLALLKELAEFRRKRVVKVCIEAKATHQLADVLALLLGASRRNQHHHAAAGDIGTERQAEEPLAFLQRQHVAAELQQFVRLAGFLVHVHQATAAEQLLLQLLEPPQRLRDIRRQRTATGGLDGRGEVLSLAPRSVERLLQLLCIAEALADELPYAIGKGTGGCIPGPAW